MKYLAAVVSLSMLVIVACASTQAHSGGQSRDTIAIVGLATDGLSGLQEGNSLVIDRYSIDSSGEYRIEAAPTDVWSALPDAYRLLGIPVEHMDPSARQIGNREFTVTRRLGRERVGRYIRCVTDAFGHSAAGRDRIVMSVVTTLADPGDGAAVIRTDLRAMPQTMGSSSAQTPCTSNGTLEQAVERAVQLVLASRVEG